MIYKLWMEVGKYDFFYLNIFDLNFNSNVWRNFCKQYGFNIIVEGRKIFEVLVIMYLLNIFVFLKVGDYMFEKYIREMKLFNDEKIVFLVMNWIKVDVQEFKRLCC